MIPAYYLANKRGIPRIESTGVNVTTTIVEYTFRNHRFLTYDFNGLVLMRLNQTIPTEAEDTATIVLNSGTGQVPLTTFNGANVTVADIPGTGIYLCYYDQTSNTIQLLTGEITQTTT